MIKFQGKPTLFMDRKLVSEYYPGAFIPQTVAKGESLSGLIEASKEAPEEKPKYSLEQLIGARGSLKDAIAQAKAAASYPPCGLHVLLKGPAGVGKKEFAACIHQYRKSMDVSSDIPFIAVPCYTFSDNPKLFAQRLLGLARSTASGKSVRGFLDAARRGILFFEEIEYLPIGSLHLLGSVISRNNYSRIGDIEPRPIECMIIASTCREPSEATRILTERLPVTIRIPDLEERGTEEKIWLILQLFSEETQTFQYPVRISKDVIACLASIIYSKQILQLSNEIKAICARALLDSMTNQYKTVYIRLHNLSQDILAFSESGPRQETIRHILEKVPDQYIELNENSLSKYFSELESESCFFTDKTQEVLKLAAGGKAIDNIYQTAVANISSLSNCKSTEVREIRKNIFPIVLQVVTAELQKRGKLEAYQSHLHLLYGVLLHITNMLKRGDASDPQTEVEALAASKESFPEEYQMALDIMESLTQIYSFRFSNREIDYLASYFAIFSNWISTVNPGILVICHGENIASDMVGYALKTICDDYIIDYINVSSAVNLKDCLDLAAEKARRLNRGSGVLILTDMEPLTTVNEYVTQKTGIDAHILYPVTLPLLLETIRQVISNQLDYGRLSYFCQSHGRRSEHMGAQEEFILNLIDKVISKTTVFIDTGKAVSVLEKCLRATLLELGRPYSNEIAAKYLCHCCNMLERTIRQENWNYSRLNNFTNENYEIMHTVEHKLEYAENIFGIKIPASEIAYVTEIFLQ